MKLIQARNATGACLSFSEIAERAMGRWGKYSADFFMVVQQLGFCIGILFFLMTSLQEVVKGIWGVDSDIWWYGKVKSFVIM